MIEAAPKFAPLNFVFRADGNAAIGLGHATRSLALARACRQRGYRVCFVTRDDNPLLGQTGLWAGLESIRLSRDVTEARDLERCAQEAAAGKSIFVIDGRAFSAAYQAALKEKGFTVIIDDTGEGEFAADLILNHHLHAPELNYPPRTRKLLGPRFALVRHEFFDARPIDLEARNAPRLLACFGGADPANVSGRVAKALGSVAPARGWQVRLILGPVYGPIDRLLTASQATPGIEVVVNPAGMAAQMQWATLGILSSSGLFLEAMASGLPSVLIATAEDQRQVLAAAARQRLAPALGWHAEVSDQSLVDAVQRLLDNPLERQRLSVAGRALVDGRGPERVLDEIESCVR